MWPLKQQKYKHNTHTKKCQPTTIISYKTFVNIAIQMFIFRKKLVLWNSYYSSPILQTGNFRSIESSCVREYFHSFVLRIKTHTLTHETDCRKIVIGICFETTKYFSGKSLVFSFVCFVNWFIRCTMTWQPKLAMRKKQNNNWNLPTACNRVPLNLLYESVFNLRFLGAYGAHPKSNSKFN